MPENVPFTDIVPEHAQVADKPRLVTPQQQQDELTVKNLEKLFSRAKLHRAKYDHKWPGNYDFYNGRQWAVERPSWRFNESVNITFATIQTIVPIMMDGKPEVEFLPPEPSDTSWTETLTSVQRENWNKNSWDYTLTECVLDSQIYEGGIGEIGWDIDREEGLGDITFDAKSPFVCYPDSFAPDVNHPRSRFFITAEPVPLKWLEEQRPKFKGKLKADVSTLLDVAKRLGDQNSASTRIYNDNDPGLGYNPEGGKDSDNSEEKVLWKRYWLKDSQIIEEIEKEENEDGTVNERTVRKLKYPKGRYMEVASKQILVDDHNGAIVGFDESGDPIIEPYRDGRFPFAKLVDYAYSREFWGGGEVDILKGPQKTVNWMWSGLLDHIKSVGNPQWIVDLQAGVEPEQITNEPGLIIEKNQSGQVTRQSGESIPGGYISILEFAMEIPKIVSGAEDVTRGAIPSSVTSGVQLEGIIEAAQTRIRQKTRNMEKFLREVGFLMLSRMLQFYTQSRVFRITGDSGLPEFVEFFMSNETGQDGVSREFANIKRFGKKLPDGNFATDQEGQPLVEQEKVQLKGIADVRTSAGSSLPFQKAQKAQTARELFNSGALTLETLLKTIGFPNAEDEARKVQEQAQAAAQAQQGAPV